MSTRFSMVMSTLLSSRHGYPISTATSTQRRARCMNGPALALAPRLHVASPRAVLVAGEENRGLHDTHAMLAAQFGSSPQRMPKCALLEYPPFQTLTSTLTPSRAMQLTEIVLS